MNEEVIAVNQDPLGKQGRLYQREKNGVLGHKEIWFGELSKDRFAVIFFNKSGSEANLELNI